MQDNLENIYELTPLQQGLLIETLSKPDTDAYTIQFILTLDAAQLNGAAWQRAWQAVLGRHAVLRSAFYWQDLDKPVQVVLRDVALPWEEHDWRGHAEVTQWATWQEADLKQPFALDEAPLFRCTLIRSDNETCRFVWTVHHLINDGWSYPILLNEVLSFYQAEVTGKPLALPMPRPFVDYIDWLQQQDMAQAEHFWREQLGGFTETTPLGASKPTATGQAAYQTQHLLLSPEQTQQLRTFAQQHRLTLNTLLQGAWAVLLARYGAGDDVVFGGIVSGRPATLPGVEAMVGMFTNTVPVRIKLAQNARLLTWLQTLQQQQLDREQYAHCSLMDIQGWSDVPRGSPLFASIFAYENYPLQADWESLGLIKAMNAVERVPYPLSFVAMLRGVMELHVHFDATRFAPVLITRLLGHLQTLLAGMVVDTDTRVQDLPLLTAAEQQDVLENLTATAQAFPPAGGIHELFEAQVARTPATLALEYEGQAFSYQALNAQANQLAVYLRGQGIQPDRPVAICLPRSPPLVISVLGILKAGGACLPLDPAYPAERLHYMLDHSGVTLLLTTPALQAQLPVTAGMQVFTGWDVLATLPSDNLPCQTQPQHLAYCLYTSGSTGQPKGVGMPHRAMLNLTQWQQADARLGQAARTLQFSPISFDVSFQEIFTTLCSGGTLVLVPEELRRDAAALLRFLETQQVERLFLPFVALQQLADVAMGGMPSSLRDVVTAGEQLRLTDALAAWFKGTACALHNHYGPTETHVVTAYTLQGEVEQWPALPPIGKPIANTRLYLLDRQGEPVARGIPGELYVAGDCLAQGYVNRPELTAERFLPNPFGEGLLYRTGDLAYWREDGNLAFLGRADTQIKIRGFRIEPGEIESLLNQHSAVKEGAVGVQEAYLGDKRLVAYVVPKSADSANLEVSVSHFLQEKLPDYMVPAAVMVLEAFPLMPSGKLDRKALPVPTWGSATLAAQALPSTPTEQQIAESWQEVLGLEAVGIHDSFFALGGHSLLVTQVISRLSQAFGLDVPFHYLFEHPTVAGLAVQIDTLLRTQALMLDDADGLDGEELEQL